ncbi:MAG: SDR family oxidoreductase [Bacteroidales bacterium]|jgi:NAD(P)-dependent dehydrogenase (short-subunit alcohol dehydrogenase family)|nr:SDR family oxidoreductase [Bacteroidales bacterium]
MTGPDGIFSIDNKVIIITGGEGVLGSTLAVGLASLGARIVIIGINEDRGKEIEQEIAAAGGKAVFHNASVLDRKALEEVRESLISGWGAADVLINAAGGNMPGASVGEDQDVFDMSIDDFRKVNELNLDGTVIPSMVFGEQMARQDKGVIVNFSSMASLRAISRVAGYSAAKAAVDNFTRWMAVEMAVKYGDGIRVNAIAPGFLVTKQNHDLLIKPDGSLTERAKKIISLTPFGRFGRPEELAGTILWLISDASAFVTGAVIPVDGGFSAWSGV